MGWIQALYETYEKSRNLVGKADGAGHILLPIAHSTQNAQLEVVIDLKGNYKSARVVEKADAVTIIPVTEDSGSRSSGIAPHPLFDKLCYIAGDYGSFYDKKHAEKYYEAYINQLEKWVQGGCHPYVNAIFEYLNKNTVIKDLCTDGVLLLDESGKLDETVKLSALPQVDAFVRFRIQDSEVIGTGAVWSETEVYDDYIRHYLTTVDEHDLDYITGEFIPCSEKQPSKIRNSADKAKLISANDSSGFTYRGRFDSRDQALSLGYLPSQEAHNALKWLLARQGYTRFGTAIVAWNTNDTPQPDWDKDSDEILGEDGLIAEVGEGYAGEVKKALQGKYADFYTENPDMVVMALGAATPGRLAITYYREMSGSDFLDRLSRWHGTCVWRMGYKRMEDKSARVMSPRPEDIVDAAYGKERNGKLTVDDKLKKETLERLLPCIIDGKKLPQDIVLAAVNNASNPIAFSGYNRAKVRDITCALIQKKWIDSGKREGVILGLDRKETNRDYLYGRLLAVADKLESDTFSKEERGKRDTNVTRYASMMKQNPVKTWGIINEKLKPYRKKLDAGVQVWYAKQFQEICDLFTLESFEAPGQLGEAYFLGFNCQMAELYREKDKDRDKDRDKDKNIEDSKEDN